MKDILVSVRDFHERTPAADYGVRLAAAFGASVTGVHVCPRPVSIAPAYGPGPVATSIVESARKLVDAATRARPWFVDWAASLGVPQASWLVAVGDATDALAQAAARHDLLVLDYAEDKWIPSWDLPRLILQTGVPCIVVPHRARNFTGFERIAVAWNGSPEAMRAVHAALPFMQGKQVLLLRGEERAVLPGVDWTPPFEIAEYLKYHGVAAEECAIQESRGDVGGVLLDEALEFEADLLVMGAYGRSRFSEMMLGGATRYVLTWADIPVLMRH